MCVRSAAKWRTRRRSSNPRQSDEVGPSRDRRRTEDITPVALEAYEEVVEAPAVEKP
jgi:hypothetical protein